MKRHHWKKDDDYVGYHCRDCYAIAENYYESDYRRNEECFGHEPRKLSTESSTPERCSPDSGTQDSPGKGSPEKATGGAPSSSDSPGGTGPDGAKGDSVKRHEWKFHIGGYVCETCGASSLVMDDSCSMACAGPKPEDKVNHPKHYTSGGVECIDAIEAVVGQMQGLDAFYTAQVLKYLWRWPLKGGVEDLKKGAWYLERLISKKEGKP